MNETVSPVCSPDYRDRMGGLESPAELAGCQLIHEIGMNTTWERWFAMMELPPQKMRGPGYTLGSMSIEAALRGEGVALGRSVPVAEDLAAGRLVALFPQAKLEVEWGYDLVYRPATGTTRRYARSETGWRKRCGSSRPAARSEGR